MRSNARPKRAISPSNRAVLKPPLPLPLLPPQVLLFDGICNLDCGERSGVHPPPLRRSIAENFRETIRGEDARRNLRSLRGDRQSGLRHCAPLQLWWTIEKEICSFPDYGCCPLVKTVVSADQWSLWDRLRIYKLM